MCHNQTAIYKFFARNSHETQHCYTLEGTCSGTHPAKLRTMGHYYQPWNYLHFKALFIPPLLCCLAPLHPLLFENLIWGPINSLIWLQNFMWVRPSPKKASVSIFGWVRGAVHGNTKCCKRLSHFVERTGLHCKLLIIMIKIKHDHTWLYLLKLDEAIILINSWFYFEPHNFGSRDFHHFFCPWYRDNSQNVTCACQETDITCTCHSIRSKGKKKNERERIGNMLL